MFFKVNNLLVGFLAMIRSLKLKTIIPDTSQLTKGSSRIFQENSSTFPDLFFGQRLSFRNLELQGQQWTRISIWDLYNHMSETDASKNLEIYKKRHQFAM